MTPKNYSTCLEGGLDKMLCHKVHHVLSCVATAENW